MDIKRKKYGFFQNLIPVNPLTLSLTFISRISKKFVRIYRSVLETNLVNHRSRCFPGPLFYKSHRIKRPVRLLEVPPPMLQPFVEKVYRCTMTGAQGTVPFNLLSAADYIDGCENQYSRPLLLPVGETWIFTVKQRAIPI